MAVFNRKLLVYQTVINRVAPSHSRSLNDNVFYQGKLVFLLHFTAWFCHWSSFFWGAKVSISRDFFKCVASGRNRSPIGSNWCSSILLTGSLWSPPEWPNDCITFVVPTVRYEPIARKGESLAATRQHVPNADTQWGSISWTGYWPSMHQTSTWCSLETCSVKWKGPYP